MMHWRLEGHDVVAVEDLFEWARWVEAADRRVALDTVGEKRVSTVFLGIDHNFVGSGPPILFETMVFPVRPVRRCKFRRHGANLTKKESNVG